MTTSVLTSLPPVEYEGKRYWLQRDLVRALNLGDAKYTPQRTIYYRRAMTKKLGRQWGSLLPVECRDGAVRKAWVVTKAEAEKFIDIRVRKIPSDLGADLRTICKSGRTYYPGIDIVRCAFPDVNQPDAYLSYLRKRIRSFTGCRMGTYLYLADRHGWGVHRTWCVDAWGKAVMEDYMKKKRRKNERGK